MFGSECIYYVSKMATVLTVLKSRKPGSLCNVSLKWLPHVPCYQRLTWRWHWWRKHNKCCFYIVRVYFSLIDEKVAISTGSMWILFKLILKKYRGLLLLFGITPIFGS